MEYLVLAVCIASLILSLTLLIKLSSVSKNNGADNFDAFKKQIFDEMRNSRIENAKNTQENMKMISDILSDTQKTSAQMQDNRLKEIAERFKQFSLENEQKLENIRITVENRLKAVSENNEKQLEKMRETVDEKLQKTLDERISQSFKLVSERLEQVYKGLGEMQTLAVGVGDLKKVLSNVKTRGILGEIQLGAILEEILSPEQYKTNVVTKPSGRDAVEFAVCLPGSDDEVVYLPIDSKFPADMYTNLVDAYDSGDAALISAAGAALERSIKLSAKTIHDKYVSPPQTTEFAIMFLPFEGLYAEVVRRGLIEPLARDYKINIAGPTTMASLLNSLQMGFRTLAIQKHSGEVWNVLGAVKTEFDKFGDVLIQTQTRLEQANKELDKLVGVRTRKIRSTLKKITSLSEIDAAKLLDEEENENLV
ncbi:MAG: DNA recombination protein RmuC [Ruminococcaceae bacterium]|nr:DNA recombination protein RmuC [Oscillospiraceae bacterium]